MRATAAAMEDERHTEHGARRRDLDVAERDLERNAGEPRAARSKARSRYRSAALSHSSRAHFSNERAELFASGVGRRVDGDDFFGSLDGGFGVQDVALQRPAEGTPEEEVRHFFRAPVSLPGGLVGIAAERSTEARQGCSEPVLHLREWRIADQSLRQKRQLFASRCARSQTCDAACAGEQNRIDALMAVFGKEAAWGHALMLS